MPTAMTAKRRSKAVASRRRRQDDGEDEEGSVMAELVDDSLSEGSVISNGDDDADVEQSDASDEEVHIVDTSKVSLATRLRSRASAPNLTSTTTGANASADVSSATNDLPAEDVKAISVADSDDIAPGPAQTVVKDQVLPVKASKETPGERNKREHMEYLKQKKEDPAFVPNRGGFFLHDNRAGPLGAAGYRSVQRGRGRGFGNGLHSSRDSMTQGPAEQPWTHDLHESVSTAAPTKSRAGQVPPIQPSNRILANTAPSDSNAPAVSFSTTVVLGKSPVFICLPGMPEKIIVPDVARKRHTLLPQHRPPLRRDKRVRVSLPGLKPWTAPVSIARSFIFIPRAQRPNQQGTGRGRGRMGFSHSRRTSVYGSSSYTPSVAMSRRSSLGGVMTDNIRSPGGPAMQLPAGYVVEQGRPVVRLPALGRSFVGMPLTAQYPGSNIAPIAAGAFPAPSNHSMAMFPPPNSQPLGLFPAANGQPVGVSPASNQSEEQQKVVHPPLMMHQPRPQKAVSVADIESPARLNFHPPAQQQEQPFHQQMPPPSSGPVYSDDAMASALHVRRNSQASRHGATPLSQIPERAIFAQPFQPYPYPPPGPGYVMAPYAANPMFYPPFTENTASYSGAVHSGAMPPPFHPGNQPATYMAAPVTTGAPSPSAPASAPTGGATAPNTVAHESNGMVYYFDSSQLPPNSEMAPAPFPGTPSGGVVGMGGMMTPPNQFYYPPPNQGVYYATQ